jgi:hypothetical protein
LHSTVAFRFAEGTEFRMTDRIPDVGDVLTRDGDRWVVTEVHHDREGNGIVTLRPLGEAGSDGSAPPATPI